eukprot:COSAG01_NODE_2039_length_8573_cov_13.642672_1_plen_2500_part_00
MRKGADLKSKELKLQNWLAEAAELAGSELQPLPKATVNIVGNVELEGGKVRGRCEKPKGWISIKEGTVERKKPGKEKKPAKKDAKTAPAPAPAPPADEPEEPEAGMLLESERGMSAAFAQACEAGNASAVRQYLAQGADPNYVQPNRSGHRYKRQGANANAVKPRLPSGWSVLQLVSAKGHAEVVQALVEAGATVDRPDKNGSTPLFVASHKGHVAAMEVLLGAGAAVDQPTKHGFTPLYVASRKGHVAAMEVLLGAGAAVDQPDKDGSTPLSVASRKGHVAAMEVLLGAGAAVDQPTKNGCTPLLFASQNGHVAAVEALLGGGAAVDQPDEHGCTPLYAASQNGHVAAMEALLGGEAAVDQPDKNGVTPLFIASYSGHADAVRCLLLAGADRAHACKGKTPLTIAQQKKHAEVVALLENPPAAAAAPLPQLASDVTSGRRTPRMSAAFANACDTGDAVAVRRFVAQGADPNYVDQGFPVLYSSAQYGHAEVIRALVEAGATVDRPTKNGCTPLYVASLKGHVAAMKVLLGGGAAVDQPTKHGFTPLYVASLKGHVAAMEVLLGAGAAVDQPIKDGTTPLSAASRKGHVAAMEVLLGGGAAVDQPTKHGFTPLLFASQNGHVAAVEALLGGGAAVDQPTKDGTTPLWLASFNGHVAVVEALLGGGAPVDQPKDGRTPLFIASQNGRVAAMEALLGAGAAVDQPNKNGSTPLWVASLKGHVAAMEALLGAGAAVDQPIKDGTTPLWLASLNGHVAAMQVLLGAGAAVDQPTKNGFTPLYVASRKGHVAAMEVLLGAGAAVDQPAKDGRTPLYVASQNGDAGAVRCLLLAGADRAHACKGKTPLSSEKEHAEVVALLENPPAAAAAAAAAAPLPQLAPPPSAAAGPAAHRKRAASSPTAGPAAEEPAPKRAKKNGREDDGLHSRGSDADVPVEDWAAWTEGIAEGEAKILAQQIVACKVFRSRILPLGEKNKADKRKAFKGLFGHPPLPKYKSFDALVMCIRGQRACPAACVSSSMRVQPGSLRHNQQKLRQEIVTASEERRSEYWAASKTPHFKYMFDLIMELQPGSLEGPAASARAEVREAAGAGANGCLQISNAEDDTGDDYREDSDAEDDADYDDSEAGVTDVDPDSTQVDQPPDGARWDQMDEHAQPARPPPVPVPRQGLLVPTVATEKQLEDTDSEEWSSDSQQPTKPVVYTRQEDIAMNLFAKISAALQDKGTPLSSFDDFAFYVQVPNMVNLFSQTVERLRKFVKEYQSKMAGQKKFFCGLFPENVNEQIEPENVMCVCSNITSAANKSKFESIRTRVKNERRTLFAFIHDEVHWEATKTTANGKRGAGAADRFMNDDELRLAHNAVHISISASPYNVVTKSSQIPAAHEIIWDEADGYYGQELFTRADKFDTFTPGSMNGTDDVYDKSCDDLQREHYGGGTVSQNARVHALVNSYVSALQKTLNDAEGKFQRAMFSRVTVHTEKIVADLVNMPLDTSDASGIMVLLRQPKRTGLQIANQLRKARKLYGLQSRFAVIVDIDQKGKPKPTIFAELEKHSPDVLQLAQQRRHNRGQPPLSHESTYEDLQDIPCILVVCEKGKMGDSFPSSLKYYDLRLRYSNDPKSRAATIQDLGRAFGYRSEEDAPIIVVGKGCMRKLQETRKKRPPGLLTIDPDDKMEPICRCLNKRNPLRRCATRLKDGSWKPKRCEKPVHPKSEFDTEVYRHDWQPKTDHFDFRGSSECTERRTDWCDNYRRFLLHGRPQIGKTGAYQHLLYLLWEATAGRSSYSPGPPPEAPLPIECERNPPEFPCYESLRQVPWASRDWKQCPASCPFRKCEKLNTHGNYGCPLHPPGYGKYGDPKVERLWRHSVIDTKKDKHPDADLFSTASLRGAGLSQPNAAPRWTQGGHRQAVSESSGIATATTDMSTDRTHSSIAGQDAVDAMQDAEDEAQEGLHDATFELQRWTPACELPRLPYPEYKEFSIQREDVGLDLDLGILTIPKHTFDQWWEIAADGSPRIKLRHEAKVVKFPLFMPTHSRSSTGRLDLSKAMRVPRLDSPEPSALEYLQILVVKEEQYSEYRKKFPHVPIHRLPVESSELGVGDARYCIQQLADVVCQEDMLGPASGRFCFMLDDSTKKFIGLTLPNDKHAHAGVTASPEMQWSKAGQSAVSFGQAMLYLQDPQFVDRGKFAAIGFHRKGRSRISHAFSRAHIYSAVLFNINLLKQKQLFFNRKVWLWEDLDFNRRVSEQGEVLCKCYRYQQVVDQNKSGGCAGLVATAASVKVCCTAVSNRVATRSCGGIVHHLNTAVVAQHDKLPEDVYDWLRDQLCTKVSAVLKRPPADLVTLGLVQSLKITKVKTWNRKTKSHVCKDISPPLDISRAWGRGRKNRWSFVEAIWVDMVVDDDLHAGSTTFDGNDDDDVYDEGGSAGSDDVDQDVVKLLHSSSTIADVKEWILSLDVDGKETIATALEEEEVNGRDVLEFTSALEIKGALKLTWGKSNTLWREIVKEKERANST